MCKICQFFEAVYQVPVEVVLDPARQEELDLDVLARSGRHGKHQPCADLSCTRSFMGRKQAVHYKLPDYWEWCLRHARLLAAEDKQRRVGEAS